MEEEPVLRGWVNKIVTFNERHILLPAFLQFFDPWCHRSISVFSCRNISSHVKRVNSHWELDQVNNADGRTVRSPIQEIKSYRSAGVHPCAVLVDKYILVGQILSSFPLYRCWIGSMIFYQLFRLHLKDTLAWLFWMTDNRNGAKPRPGCG